ncbi:nuclear transport factor 2 family protein [Endozoicomonas arenosclerae]|uniref:nuclear transport factor 2 family protein n=1 Tax=Endozoicomonas arenosclerae TaxID=1633495 RepID=UPI0007861B7C|nr:nuclear transport factor 2 family protein [Endozoicomonas arenosclerae]
MKPLHLPLLFSLLILPLISGSVSADDRKDLETMMKGYVSAYEQGDVKAVSQFYVQDANIDIWGTAKDEHATNLNEVKVALMRDFKEAKTRITTENIRVLTHGEAGVILSDWEVEYQHNGSEKWQKIPMVRSTLYAEKRNGDWKIRHAHWSEPQVYHPEGRSFPVDK